VRDPDMRVLFHYFYTGITPAMVAKMVGIGSQYVSATTDSQGTLYDNQTRSMLQTDQQFPSVNSTGKGIGANPDGSVDVWFGPTLPQGVNAANWAQTIPGKGWNALFRLYGPLQPWFDKTWRVGEFVEMK
jgi:hypothetical protein